MKTIKTIWLTLLSIILLLITGCSKDDEGEKVSSYIGVYSISNATLNESLTLTTNEIGVIAIPQGTDIKSMISEALLSALSCTSTDNSRIELREEGSLYMSCAGENKEINAGTWEEAGEKVLKLNLNSTAIPSSPTGISLEVTDVSWSGNTLSGNTSVPMAEAMFVEMIQQMSGGQASLNTDATPDVSFVNIAISFTKQ